MGAVVTIGGTNFGLTQGSSTVTFNGTPAASTSWSGSSIGTLVPNGATTGNVVVTVGSQASNGAPFTVSPPPPPPSPTLTSLSPASGAVGAVVTIGGTNFGLTQGSSTVTFNGTPATSTGWSASSIGTLVPSGATTGGVVVLVGGQASNAITFTVSQSAVVTATWNANTETDLAGYVLSFGTATGVYSTSVNVGNLTTWQGPLTSGVSYYFALQAYDTSLQFSPYSAEVVFDVGSGTLTQMAPASGASPTIAAVVLPFVASHVAVATAASIDPTLAASWQLNDGIGLMAFDSSGGGMNGTLVNGPAWTTGRLGGALSFNGVNQLVSTDFVENLTAWTVAVWVRSPAAPSSAPASGPVDRSKNFQINWNDPDAAFRGAVAERVGGTWYAASFGPLVSNTWYHLAGTYDGGTLRAYVNGVLSTTNPLPSGKPDPESLTLALGSRAGTRSYFAGVVNGVRIYSRAISAAEVAALARPNALPPLAVTLSASPTGQAVSLIWTASADPNSAASSLSHLPRHRARRREEPAGGGTPNRARLSGRCCRVVYCLLLRGDRSQWQRR